MAPHPPDGKAALECWAMGWCPPIQVDTFPLSRTGKEVRLQSKVTVITGAGAGMGIATARRFAAEGARLIARATGIPSASMRPSTRSDTTAARRAGHRRGAHRPRRGEPCCGTSSATPSPRRYRICNAMAGRPTQAVRTARLASCSAYCLLTKVGRTLVREVSWHEASCSALYA